MKDVDQMIRDLRAAGLDAWDSVPNPEALLRESRGEESMIEQGKHVVVTTQFRGVFFGVLEAHEGTDVTITDAMVCVYWSQSTRGFLGLAVTGPLDGSRVSKSAPRLSLAGVTSVTECTPEAVEKWKGQPWS